MASLIDRTQDLARKLTTMRARVTSGQVFQLRDIKEIRSDTEQLLIDWRVLRGSVSEDTYFSVLEVLADTLNHVNRVYLETITRGRGRLFRDFLVFREEGENRDYGIPTIIQNPILRSSEYDDDLGSRREDYQYQQSFRYTVTFGDTLQSISKRFTGTEDNWQFIAQVNSLDQQRNLQAGDEIVVPILNTFGTDDALLDDYIITETPDQELPSGRDVNLGTDILVDGVRGIVLNEDGQVSTVSGLENVKQALNHRLRTQLGSLIQHSDTYGLPSIIGAPGVGLSVSYVRISIANTLIHDPRVARVVRVNVSHEEDIIRVGVSIQLVRNAGLLDLQTEIRREG